MATLNTALRTEQIRDDAIDNDKLANITQGSVKVGGASAAPTDLDAKTDGYILVGDGTDVNSVAVSGDITLVNDGTVAIASGVIVDDDVNASAAIAMSKLNLAITDSEVAADAAIALDKIVDMADTKIMIGSGSGNAEYALSGDVTMTNAGVTAIGATKVTDAMVNDDVATGLAGVGLVAASGVLAVDLDEVTEVAIAVADDYVVFLDASDNGDTKKEKWADIATAIAGSGLTATNGVLSADAVSDNIIEADILLEDESVNCDGNNTTFTLASTPVANSVQVFLNGLLQQAGSGKDYTLSGTTVEFVTAPDTNDILLVHYIRND